MKVKSILFFLILISIRILPQNSNGNLSEILSNTNSNENDSPVSNGNWTENTNLSHKLTVFVESDVMPSELGFYLGQDSFEFYSLQVIIQLDIRYDNGNWVTLLQNGITTGQFFPNWNSVGLHTMDIRYWYSDAVTHNLSYKVYVVPPRNKIYYDGLGNWVSGWTGTTLALDRPIIMVEGFDPVNTTSPSYYYGKAMNFLDRIRGLDADVIIFNYANGGRDLAENAEIIKGFTRYIETIKIGSQKIILSGLSMGGVVARYALASAEVENLPLNVSHFLSIDAPQQGALLPRDFQDYMNENDDDSPNPSLNTIAAKQMLVYNTYDPNRNTNNSAHNLFYNILNNLNGDGYPHDCINVGVSFAPDINNPNLGEWLTVVISGIIPDKHFYLWNGNECLVAGSYLPLSATVANGYSFFYSWELVRHLNPTFIPVNSALDILNSISKFDKNINSAQFNYHDNFPDDIIDPIAYEIGLLPDSYTDVTFWNKIASGLEESEAGGSLKVIDYSGVQSNLDSGDDITLLSNQQHSVETLDRYRLNFSNTSINYQQSNWNKEADEYKTKHLFKGWNNNGQQKAYFQRIDKATVKNSCENVFSSGSITIKDPWYKIGDSQPNTFQPFNSPFTPGTGNYLSYGGLFLNQGYDPEINIWTPPYYSVKVDAVQDIPLFTTGVPTGNGRTHKFYFQNWSAGSTATFQNANALETPVVFTQEGATAQANLKGTQLSNTLTTYNNTSQNKFIKTYEGSTEYLHNVYESMGDVWYERSTDGGTTWTIMNGGKPINPYSDYQEAKSPSIACSNDGTNLIYITYQSTTNENCFPGPVVMLTQFKNGQLNWHRTVYDLSGFSFSEDYQPVVAAMSGVVLVVFNPPSPLTLGLIAREYLISFNGSITSENSRTLPNVDASSCYPSITAAAGLYHLAYQQAAFSIKYLRWPVNTNPLTSSYSSTPSTGSGYSLNTEPSISLAYFNPVISWKGSHYSGSPQAVLRRGTLSGTNIIWSDFLKVGSNANYVHNNSAYYTPPSTAEKTVMCWGENNSIIKWVKRTFDSSHTTYSTPANLSHTGIRSQITSGSDYNNMKANILRSSTPLYYFTQSTTDFSVLQEQGGELNKITVDDTIVTFGRTGVADINGIEFVFNIGDILVGDSIIQFIDKPDTIVYASSNELNEFTRTNNFTLDPETNFYFSNIYYVVQKSDPETALSTNDAVNFKVELVNAITDQVVGTFDNITYDKNNLEKYASIDYEVDCSGITPCDYYLRLVTSVNGDANYALANIISDNTTLAKKNFNKVNFAGSEIPITYELSNNFPNPFNPSTTIRYQIPQDGIVTLKIYDILGSEVATLVNEEKVAGKYEVNFNASSLASGVYIYKIQAGSFISSKKMILLK